MPSSSSPGRFARRQVLEENEDEFQAAIQKGDLEGLEARCFGAMPSYKLNTSRLHHARRSSEGGMRRHTSRASLPRGAVRRDVILQHVMVCHARGGDLILVILGRERAREEGSLSLSLSRARAANRIDADYLLLLWRSSSSSL